MNFDPTKPVQTRDGRKVRIICTDANIGKFNIIALVEKDSQHPGDESVVYYTDSGQFAPASGPQSGMDLINVPVEHERTYWLLHFKDGGIGVLPSKPQAVSGFIRAITGPHTIKFTEGEGQT